MNRKRVFARLAAILLIAAFMLVTQAVLPQESADELYQAALLKKEAEGDLNAAVQLFQKIVATFAQNRAIAAKAELQIGLCYEKLGLTQARDAFQRVVEKYPEQTDSVAAARERLSVLGRAQALIEKGDSGLRIRRVPELMKGKISKDGRWLCGMDDTGDLFVMETGTGSKRRLTQNASLDKGDFVDDHIISPDSKRVAYVWWSNNRSRDLKIINIDGTGERTLRTDAEPSAGLWPCDWTPDGRYLLAKGREPNQFVLISVSDGAIQVIKNLGRSSPQRVNLSPDGRWIAYDLAEKENADARDIFLLSADGKREVPLVQHPADDRLLGWAPGGNQILFSRNRVKSGILDVWIVPVEDGKVRGTPVLVSRNVGSRAIREITPMGFTQDGSFYYTAFAGKSDVYLAVLDPEKAKVSTPAKNIAQGFEGANRCPAWSSDGKYLAYLSDRESDESQVTALCILSLDTGEYRVVFPQMETVTRISWFADGESVLAIGGAGFRPTADGRIAGMGTICLINVRTGGVRTIPEYDGIGIPRGTPDGKKILYANASPQEEVSRIISYDIVSGQKKEIYRRSGRIAPQMDISPDGKLLAFLDVADSSFKIIPTEGGEPRVLYGLESRTIGTFSWSPDGKYIYFLGNMQGRGGLWRIPPAGGEPVRFDLAVNGGMQNFDIHPDGRRIVFDSQRFGRDVWVMENFLPKR
jgi:Tol biopolymer transport system component